MRGLDYRIDIERKVVSPDGYGQPIETWSKLASRRAAWVKPVSGFERYASDQVIGRQQTEFRIRWSSTLADLNPLDRIVYPATSSPPANEDIYDIVAVNELGRREALQIIAARRSEIA